MTAAVFAGAVLTLGLVTPTAAFASDYTGPPPSVSPKVLASQYEKAAVAGTAVAGTAVAAAKGETLPFTGGDVAEMTLIGAGAVLVGVVAVRRGRRGINPA